MKTSSCYPWQRTATYVLCALLILRLLTMWVIPLTDTTEARYAEIARKMLETGNWVTPQHDYGVPFWAKPPLSTWLSAASMGLFGVNELAARLPSLLMSLVVSSLEGIRVWLAVIGCCYLFWLSWKLLKASAPESREVAKPMGFLAAALFQWVNPKVWVMVINSAILFMPGQPSTTSVFMLALMSAVVNFPCILVWAFGGDRLRHWLQQAWALRAFNVVMACLLALTAVWMLADEFTA